MIAERARVEVEQVRNLEHGKPLENGGNRAPLHDIAGVQQEAAGAVLALVTDHGGQAGKAAVAVFERAEAGMNVIRVQDGDRPEIVPVLRAGEPDEENRHRQKALKGLHIAPNEDRTN